MREALVLGALVIASAVAQTAILPEFLSSGWRPDIGLMLALVSLAFLPKETGLIFVFAQGLQADLLGSTRFGLFTLCYLLAARIVLNAERELARSGAWGAWLAAIAGTLIAHGSYLLLGQCFGLEIGLGDGLIVVWDRVCAAAVFGGFAAFSLGEGLAWAELLSPEAKAFRGRSVRRGFLRWRFR